MSSLRCQIISIIPPTFLSLQRVALLKGIEAATATDFKGRMVELSGGDDDVLNAMAAVVLESNMVRASIKV